MRLAGLFARRAPLPERDVLRLPDTNIAYAIRASARRRTLSLELRADGSLTVATPRGLSLTTIRAFVESRRAWIDAKRALLEHVHRHTGTRLDEHVLTIGFARRATAYQRATLPLISPASCAPWRSPT